jgi:DNA primase
MSAVDISAIKAATPISSVIGRHVKLSRAGREFKGCCPFHPDRSPSFTVNDDKGFYHCFGCGAHGDVLDFVQAIERVGLRAAAEIIGKVPAVPLRAPEPPTLQTERQTQAAALDIWRNAVPINGTPAETYLRTRGLICRLPECLRFARLPYGKRGSSYNVLIALAATAEGELTGIQRTYLNDAGTGKAGVPKPKLSLGRIGGSAIRLAPPAGEMVICEGLEDGLTLQQELGVATWVAAGVSNMRTMRLPTGVRSVIIGADADAAGEAGAQETAKKLTAEGLKVRIIRPFEGFSDFNDELRGRAAWTC